MSISRGTKIYIYDYLKESENKYESNKENVPSCLNINENGSSAIKTINENNIENLERTCNSPVSQNNIFEPFMNSPPSLSKNSSFLSIFNESENNYKVVQSSENVQQFSVDEKTNEFHDSESTASILQSLPNENTKSKEKLNPHSSFDEILTYLFTPPTSQRVLNSTNNEIRSNKKCSLKLSTNSSFDDILTQLFTPSTSQNIKTSTAFTQKTNATLSPEIVDSNQNYENFHNYSLNFEVSTLTSFDENLVQSSPVITKKKSKRNYVKNKKECKRSSRVLNHNNSHVLLPVNQCSSKNNLRISEDANSTTSKNILNILSQGHETGFNISKIGTEKWLQLALSTPRDNLGGKKRLTEINNDFNTNKIASNTEQTVVRYRKGETKIYKIVNKQLMEEVSVSEETDPELRFENEELICEALPSQVDKNKIKAMIFKIFTQLYDVFERNEIPCFKMRAQSYKNCIIKDGRLQLKSKATMGRYYYSTKFCLMLYIMAKTYMLLENNNKLTKREIFYQIKHLVKNQTQVNNAIHEVTRLLNVGDWHLNIVAHSGLVYGDLELVRASGEVTNCNAPATLIPYDLDNIVEVRSNADFILVVEKESIFHKLLQEDLPNKLARPFIMITGKGVPDFNTRVFLHKLNHQMAIPIFILVDADVYGIRIMLNYRFGAVKSCHLSDYLAVPNARWLGVFPSEISKFGMKHLMMSKRESKIAESLILSPYVENQPRIFDELITLITTNKKASIEGLIKNNTFLSDSYLPTKFYNQDFV